MRSVVEANRYVVLRLPSDAYKIVEMLPNTSISVGKFGSFSADLLIGKPLYATYEILEVAAQSDTGAADDEGKKPAPLVRLRLVPASELNQEATYDASANSNSDHAEPEGIDHGEASPIAGVIRNNQHTIDDATRQTLSTIEIEELKKASTGNGREIIERILSGHKNLDEKTIFSLAKYTLRKAKKYLRRFTVLPMDPGRLAQYFTWDRDVNRIMELREESLGMITAWSNVHNTPSRPVEPVVDGTTVQDVGLGRWLVIDDTGGLVVAALAEKLGILYPKDDGSQSDPVHATNGTQPPAQTEQEDAVQGDISMPDVDAAPTDAAGPAPSKPRPSSRFPTIACNNTIHILHAASQPNINLLKYFAFDPSHPSASHPLSSHLLSLSLLQLLHPEEDKTYTEPPLLKAAELEQLKPAKRSAYHRKRRRWQRCRAIVDGARAGSFDGLVCATSLAPTSYLKHLVPLVKGGGHIVLYSPTPERLVGVADLYSRERRSAYLELLDEWRARREQEGEEGGEGAGEFTVDEEDFPVDPRLLLGGSILTSRARQWQVLPGRTHPVMTSKGGGEGYVFTARRVVPFEGKVEARGNFSKKRKTLPS